MLQNPSLQTLLDYTYLHKLTHQACIATNPQHKQSAINILSQLILNDTINPQYLYKYISNNKIQLNDWEITCFVLMEIIYDNAHKFGPNKLLQYTHCLGKIIRELYQGPNTFIRVVRLNNQVNKQELKTYVKISLKRTLGKIIKYLMGTKTQVKQYFSIQSLLPKQNQLSLTLAPAQKAQLYFMIQIALGIIQAMLQQNQMLGFIQLRFITHRFQIFIIIQLLKALPIIMFNMNTQIQVFQLIDTIQNTLSLKQQSHMLNKSKLSEIELPLKLVQSLLYFTQKSELFTNQNQPSTTEYPQHVATLIASKQFVTSLFSTVDKFVTYISNEIQNLNQTKENASNIRLQQYLKYYKITTGYLSQICKIKLPKLSLFEQDLILYGNQQIGIQEYYQMFLITIISNIFKLHSKYFQNFNKLFESIITNNTLTKIQQQQIQIILILSYSLIEIIYNLINNIEFTTLLQQFTTNKQQFNVNIQTIYKTFMEIFRNIWNLNIKYYHNITLELYYNYEHNYESNYQYNNSSSNNKLQYNKCSLKMLCKIWQHILQNRDGIQIKMIIVFSNEELLENQNNTSKIQQQIIRNVTEIMLMFIMKIFNQNQSILAQQSPLINNNTKYVELKHELDQFFKPIACIIKTSNIASITLILNCIKNYADNLEIEWKNRWNKQMNKTHIALLFQSNQHRQLKIIQNRLSNVMLLMRKIIIDFDQIHIATDNILDNQNIARHQIYHIQQQICSKLQSFCTLYAKEYMYQPKQYYVDQSIIIYTSTYLQYLIHNNKFAQSQSQKAMRNTFGRFLDQENIFQGEFDGEKLAEMVKEITSKSIVSDSSINIIASHLNILTDIANRCMDNLRKIISKLSSSNTKSSSQQNYKQFSINFQLIQSIIDQYRQIALNYKIVYYQYICLINQAHKQYNLLTTTKGDKFQKTRYKYEDRYNTYQHYNGNEKNPILEKYNFICQCLVMHTQRIYSTLTININNNNNNINNAFYEEQINMLITIHQNLFQLLGSLLLHHQPHQRIEYIKLEENFNQILKILRVPYIKSLKENNSLQTKFIAVQGVLELCVSGLSGVFSSFDLSSTQRTPIPTLFFSFLHKQILINDIMEIYLTVSNNRNSEKVRIRKIYILLQLHRAIINSLRQITGMTKAAVQIQYRITGLCLPFWTAALQYFDSFNQQKFFEYGEQFFMDMFIIFQFLFMKNPYLQSNINFCLLHQQYGTNFQNFFIKILQTYYKLYTYGNSEIQNTLSYYKNLSNIIEKSFESMCKNLIEFIFEYNTHQKIRNNANISEEMCKKLVVPFTQILIVKMRQFIVKGDKFIKSNKIEEKGNDRRGDEPDGIKLDAYHNIPSQKLVELEQLLGLFKVVFVYIRRAILYQHNQPLQQNIKYFLLKMHADIIKNEHYSFSNKESIEYHLQFKFFEILVKLALTLTSKFRDNTCILDYICQLLPYLAGVFNHYHLISQQQSDPWGKQVRRILEQNIGVSSETFLGTWQQSYNEQIDYEQEGSQFSIWFRESIDNQFKLFTNARKIGNQPQQPMMPFSYENL